MAWTDTSGGWTANLPRRAAPLAGTVASLTPTQQFGGGDGPASIGDPATGVQSIAPLGAPSPLPATIPTPGTRTDPVAPAPVSPPPVLYGDPTSAAPAAPSPTPPVAAPTAPPTGTTAPPPRRTFALSDYLTDFGPGNDLQATQINPQASARVQDLRNAATGLVNTQPTFQQIAPTASARTGRYAGLVDEAASELATGPDREALALRAFQRLLDETAPQYAQELRQVNDAAAAGGRVGSGLTTNDLGTVAQRRNESLTRAQQALADQAAGLTLSDQAARTSALAGLEGSARGFDASDRAELRGERSAEQDAFQRALSNYLGTADTFARDEGNARDELRAERGYQTAQEQTAFERALRAAQFNADNDYRTASLGLQDSQIQAGQAGQAAGGLADLFRQIALGESSGNRQQVQGAVDALRAAGLTDEQIVDQINRGGDLG